MLVVHRGRLSNFLSPISYNLLRLGPGEVVATVDAICDYELQENRVQIILENIDYR